MTGRSQSHDRTLTGYLCQHVYKPRQFDYRGAAPTIPSSRRVPLSQWKGSVVGAAPRESKCQGLHI